VIDVETRLDAMGLGRVKLDRSTEKLLAFNRAGRNPFRIPLREPPKAMPSLRKRKAAGGLFEFFIGRHR
jgi:hypothetical protein